MSTPAAQAALEEARAAEQVRQHLRQAQRARRRAQLGEARAVDETRRWLRVAQSTPGITMGEAAALAGITRARVYQLLQEDRQD